LCRRRRSRLWRSAAARRSRTWCAPVRRSPARWSGCSSEVALLLAVFHPGLGDAVVRAGGAALGDAGAGDLGHDGGVVGGVGLHAAGAGGVADGAEAHELRAGLLAGEGLEEPRVGQEHAVALDHLPLVCVVDLGQRDVLALDVLPDVELGPVGQREDTDVLVPAVPTVVELPQLRPLGAGVPGTEGVAEGEDPLLGAGLLLVAPGAAEYGVEAVLLDAAQQGGGLEPVAAGAGAGLLDHAARVDVVLDVADVERDAGVGDHP